MPRVVLLLEKSTLPNGACSQSAYQAMGFSFSPNSSRSGGYRYGRLGCAFVPSCSKPPVMDTVLIIAAVCALFVALLAIVTTIRVRLRAPEEEGKKQRRE